MTARRGTADVPMSVTDTDTDSIDTDRHGNRVYERGTVDDLDPEKRGYLGLKTGGQGETNRVLEKHNVDHDPDSIVAEDSYSSVWTGTNPETGEYELWASYASVPYLTKSVVRLV